MSPWDGGLRTVRHHFEPLWTVVAWDSPVPVCTFLSCVRKEVSWEGSSIRSLVCKHSIGKQIPCLQEVLGVPSEEGPAKRPPARTAHPWRIVFAFQERKAHEERVGPSGLYLSPNQKREMLTSLGPRFLMVTTQQALFLWGHLGSQTCATIGMFHSLGNAQWNCGRENKQINHPHTEPHIKMEGCTHQPMLDAILSAEVRWNHTHWRDVITAYHLRLKIPLPQIHLLLKL
jgi:hypothetical protein